MNTTIIVIDILTRLFSISIHNVSPLTFNGTFIVPQQSPAYRDEIGKPHQKTPILAIDSSQNLSVVIVGSSLFIYLPF